jgi:hypothetical protein
MRTQEFQRVVLTQFQVDIRVNLDAACQKAYPSFFMPAVARRLEIFTESVIRKMTRIANKHQAINLAPGFPDFNPSDVLLDISPFGSRPTPSAPNGWPARSTSPENDLSSG